MDFMTSWRSLSRIVAAQLSEGQVSPATARRVLDEFQKFRVGLGVVALQRAPSVWRAVSREQTEPRARQMWSEFLRNPTAYDVTEQIAHGGGVLSFPHKTDDDVSQMFHGGGDAEGDDDDGARYCCITRFEYPKTFTSMGYPRTYQLTKSVYPTPPKVELYAAGFRFAAEALFLSDARGCDCPCCEFRQWKANISFSDSFYRAPKLRNHPLNRGTREEAALNSTDDNKPEDKNPRIDGYGHRSTSPDIRKNEPNRRGVTDGYFTDAAIAKEIVGAIEGVVPCGTDGDTKRIEGGDEHARRNKGVEVKLDAAAKRLSDLELEETKAGAEAETQAADQRKPLEDLKKVQKKLSKVAEQKLKEAVLREREAKRRQRKGGCYYYMVDEPNHKVMKGDRLWAAWWFQGEVINKGCDDIDGKYIDGFIVSMEVDWTPTNKDIGQPKKGGKESGDWNILRSASIADKEQWEKANTMWTSFDFPHVPKVSYEIIGLAPKFLQEGNFPCGDHVRRDTIWGRFNKHAPERSVSGPGGMKKAKAWYDGLVTEFFKKWKNATKPDTAHAEKLGK